ncbi:retrovirus-related pol polyprotein from transposon TNT 1-94 [Tanacetum coccineum]
MEMGRTTLGEGALALTQQMVFMKSWQAYKFMDCGKGCGKTITSPLKEEVYVAQPEGFVDPDHPEKVYLPDIYVDDIKAPQGVCYCARYQARPTQKHLKEVKRIFKYLKGKDSGFKLTAFSDADHAGCIDTRKSTSGGIQFDTQ